MCEVVKYLKKCGSKSAGSTAIASTLKQKGHVTYLMSKRAISTLDNEEGVGCGSQPELHRSSPPPGGLSKGSAWVIVPPVRHKGTVFAQSDSCIYSVS